MFFVTDHRIDFVGLTVDLFQIVLILFNSSFVAFNGLEISISDWTGLGFTFVVHSDFDGLDDGFELKLDD